MRSTAEIIADLKDNKEVSYEELRLAALVQSFVIWQYQQDVQRFLKGGLTAEIVTKLNYEGENASKTLGYSKPYVNAMRRDPAEFLGTEHIPGTAEWKPMHELSMKIFDKFTKEDR